MRRFLGSIAIAALGAAASGITGAADPPAAGAAPNDAFLTVATADGDLKYLYIFGTPASWRTPLLWRYNDSGRPAASFNKTEVMTALNAAAAQWTSACAITILQNPPAPETTTPAQDFAGTKPSASENVVGWGDLSAGGSLVSGITHTSGLTSVGITTLTDADITLSTANVRSAAVLKATAVHEFGHAIGLAHSNVSNAVMSGPASSSNPDVPGTDYSGIGDLQPDDIQGCLCLYGPASATAGRGYLCGLPTVLDFGTVAVAATSATQPAILTNHATSGSLTVGEITFSDTAFQRVSGCAPGTVLAPGASCTANIAFKPASTGPRQAFVQIPAGTLGPYEFPVVGTGGSAPVVAPPATDIVEFYNTTLDNFFITANATEQASILAGGAGPGWIATGARFKNGGSSLVCRFYGSLSPGPNSHFYTIDPAECQALEALQAATPASLPRWNFESRDFASTPPTAGACPAGTLPVYRAFNNGPTRGVDSNHRITTNVAAYQGQIAQGWTGEGVVMCAPG